jgi:hypothetical protein
MKNNELNLYQKINEVMKKVESVNKGATIEMGKGRTYTAVNHDDVTSLLHKPLADIGIVAMPDMCEVALELVEKEVEYQGKISKKNDYLIKVWASVEFINSDKPDERIKTRAFSYALDSGDKATGKAYSMAIKYAYLKTFMLESCDEEESRDYEKNRTFTSTQSNSSNQKEAVNNQIKMLKTAEPKVVYVDQKVEVDNPELIKKISLLEKEKHILEMKVKLNDEEAQKYRDLKNQIDQLTHDKEDVKRKIEAATSISGLVIEIEHLINTKLAPVKYSKALTEAKDNPTVIKNINEILNIVESWCDEMKNLINDDLNQNYIIVDGGIIYDK